MSPFIALALLFSVHSASTLPFGDASTDAALPSGDASTNAPFEFPPGPVAERILVLKPDTAPTATPADLGARQDVPTLDANVWTKAVTWESWSDLVKRESQAGGQSAERRARLALLAAAQGRAEDAWNHCAAIGDPAWVAAILPRFLPGVPRGSPSGVGGAPGALPDGVVLSPSLPPPSREARNDGRVDRRAMSIRSFHVGRAVVSMRVSVEAEGVQIDVRHVAGESARLAILIPESPDYAFADEYVDWYRQDRMRVPHVIEVKSGEAEHTLYGRFEPRAQIEHSRVPRALPGSVREGGVWFTLAADDPERALVVKIAETLEKHSFGFEVGVRAPHAESKAWSGVTFDLANAATRAEKLAWLASAVEEFALR